MAYSFPMLTQRNVEQKQMVISFEDFTLDTERVELRRGKIHVNVEPQVFDLIAYLATHTDRVIDREELIANVWRGRIVSDAAISTRINAARRALGDDGRSQRVIRTVPRRGFRFVAEVATQRPRQASGDAPCFVIASPRATELLFDVGGVPSATRLEDDRKRIAAHLERHGGRVRSSVGDEVHAVFAETGKALAAALEAQQELVAERARVPVAMRAAWRIVLGSSDTETHGLLKLAPPDAIVVAAAVRERFEAGDRPGAPRLVPLDATTENPPAFSVSLPSVERSESNPHPAPHCRALDLPLPANPSIIIRPFVNLGGDDGNDHLATGIRLDVQTALVKISGLFVIAAGPANSYAARAVPAHQVGREMGVHYVLDGSVQRAGQRLRVMAQLTDTRDNQVIWAERYDATLDDELEVQDDITRHVVTALDVKLVGGEQARVWRHTLRDPHALDTFYRGLTHFMRMDRENLAVARELFMRVFALAPDVALGPTYLAICHWWEALRGWSESAAASLDEAGRWGERAVAMEDADGQAHGILAHVYLQHGRHDDALRVGAEGVAIRPLCANTNAFYASVLNYAGAHAEAVERMRCAIRYAPIYAPWWLDVLASAYLHSGEHGRALAVTREALRLNPSAVDACLIGAAACSTGGWASEARYLVRDALERSPALTAGSWCAGLPPYREERTRNALEQALIRAGMPA